MTEKRYLAFPAMEADQQEKCHVYPICSYAGVMCEILIVCDAFCAILFEALDILLLTFQQNLYLQRNKSLIKA